MIQPRVITLGSFSCFYSHSSQASQYYPESTVKLMAPCIIPELHFIKKAITFYFLSLWLLFGCF